jgi:MFS family permease
LALWRLVQGLLTSGIVIITIAYITEEWLALQIPRVMSIYVAGTVFGGFVGGSLATHYGWRAMFLIPALSALFAVYLVGLVVTLVAGTILAWVGLRYGMLAAIGLCCVRRCLHAYPFTDCRGHRSFSDQLRGLYCSDLCE